MSIARPHRAENSHFSGEFRTSFGRNHPHIYGSGSTAAFTANRRFVNNNHRRNYNNPQDFLLNEAGPQYNMYNYVDPEALPSYKRRKFSATSWESFGSSYNQSSASYQYTASNLKITYPPLIASDVHARAGTSTSYKRDTTRFEDEDSEFCRGIRLRGFPLPEKMVLMPRRKRICGTLTVHFFRTSVFVLSCSGEATYDLGPQTTIGTAVVLCHRFFVRRSHACHDRFLIATAALFLAAKSEETPCPLNNVLRASSEIFHKQDFNVLCYVMPVDWFDQYREQVTEAEQIILTTLNFELNVQHPYAHLTSILDKLGVAQSLLVNLALSLVSEGGYKWVACTLYDFLSWWIDMQFYFSSEVEQPMMYFFYSFEGRKF